jgi:predicted phage baseplate assembly protein
VANVTSNRGRLVAPNLDDRTWDDLVAQARDLIPRYAPHWTDHNPSDLGITLIELFAFLVEGLAYRLNQVPEKNYVAFLNLLGVTRDPQTPAKTFLTFTAQQGQVVTVPRGQQAQTEGSETESPVVFETDRDVVVLPITLKNVVLLDANYHDISSRLAAAPAAGRVIAIAAGATVTLALGFDAASREPIDLEWLFSSPLVANQKVTWRYSNAAAAPGVWPEIPAEGRAARLEHDGVSRLQVPSTGAAAWGPQKPGAWGVAAADGETILTEERHWLAVQISNVTAKPLDLAVDRILFNSVPAHAALTVLVPEELGVSDGTPFQLFSLANRPLFRVPDHENPYRDLDVKVGGVSWKRVDELPADEVEVFRVDPVGGDISFGNFDPVRKTGRGRTPPVGSRITATYRYVDGGLRTNVGPQRVNALRTPVQKITGVTNFGASFGASDEEPIDETLRRAPEMLKVRDRAVTADDYEYLAREASTDVAIVRCLTPRRHDRANLPNWNLNDAWNFAGMPRFPGRVFVIVVPDIGRQDIAAIPRPQPSRDLLDEVQAYLTLRQPLTARLTVTGPRYLPIIVTAKILVFQSAVAKGLIRDARQVATEVRTRLQRFLHPKVGGPDGTGWQVGQNVFLPDVVRAVMPSDQIGFVSELKLEPPAVPPYHDAASLGPFDQNKHRPFHFSAPGTWVQLTDYELVCFGDETKVEAVEVAEQ